MEVASHLKSPPLIAQWGISFEILSIGWKVFITFTYSPDVSVKQLNHESNPEQQYRKPF